MATPPKTDLNSTLGNALKAATGFGTVKKNITRKKAKSPHDICVEARASFDESLAKVSGSGISITTLKDDRYKGATPHLLVSVNRKNTGQTLDFLIVISPVASSALEKTRVEVLGHPIFLNKEPVQEADSGKPVRLLEFIITKSEAPETISKTRTEVEIVFPENKSGATQAIHAARSVIIGFFKDVIGRIGAKGKAVSKIDAQALSEMHERLLCMLKGQEYKAPAPAVIVAAPARAFDPKAGEKLAERYNQIGRKRGAEHSPSSGKPQEPPTNTNTGLLTTLRKFGL